MEKPFDYLLAGKQHSVQLVNVNAKGQLLTNGGAMEVQFLPHPMALVVG